MPIVAADIQSRYSGGAGNASAAASLGGAESATAFASGVANNLWDDVSGAESAAGDIEYRGFFWHNGHATLALQSAVTWIDALTTAGDTEFDIGLDPAANGAAMAVIANESTAPAGVTFTRPTSNAAGLSIGNIAAGSYKGVWVRRTVTAGAVAAADSGSIRIEGDTAA